MGGRQAPLPGLALIGVGYLGALGRMGASGDTIPNPSPGNSGSCLREASGVNLGAEGDQLCPSIQTLAGEFGKAFKERPGSPAYPRAEAQQLGALGAEVHGDLHGWNSGLSLSWGNLSLTDA